MSAHANEKPPQTDPKALSSLRKAAKRPITQEERREQQISFIMGTMGDGSAITRNDVIGILEKRGRGSSL